MDPPVIRLHLDSFYGDYVHFRVFKLAGLVAHREPFRERRQLSFSLDSLVDLQKTRLFSVCSLAFYVKTYSIIVICFFFLALANDSLSSAARRVIRSYRSEPAVFSDLSYFSFVLFFVEHFFEGHRTDCRGK